MITRPGIPMRESFVETLIGLFVVAGAGLFLWYALATGRDGGTVSGASEYGIRFENAAGISPGTDVRFAGTKVGTVRDVKPDFDRDQALVTIAISSELELDSDTSVRVQSESLLGGSYLGIERGAGYDIITPCGDGEVLFGETGCGEILFSQGTVDLMTLFASFASGSGGEDE